MCSNILQNTLLGSSSKMQARKCKINRLQQYYLINNKQWFQEYSKRHKKFSKASILLHKRTFAQCNGTKNHERKWERMRKRWERDGTDFGIVELLWGIDDEMRRGRHSFILGETRNPSWMNYKCHTSKRDRQSQGGRTFRVLEQVRVWGVRGKGGKHLYTLQTWS